MSYAKLADIIVLILYWVLKSRYDSGNIYWNRLIFETMDGM